MSDNTVLPMIKCDHCGCNKPVCETDLEFTPPTLRFCAEHSAQCNELIETRDIAGLLVFWIKAGSNMPDNEEWLDDLPEREL